MFTLVRVARPSGSHSSQSGQTRRASVWVPPAAAKSTYAAALAGDYREAPLLINAVALLASASLACPRGDSTIENQWRNALLALVQAGLLTLDSDHKVTPEALGVVLPRMKASGLEHGEALAAWMRATTVAEAAPASAPAEAEAKEARTRDAGTAAKPWAQEWQREWQPIMRVLGGAQSLGKLAALVEGCEFRFAPSDLIAALLKWDGGRKSGVVPQKSEQTLSRALKGFAPGFSWLAGNRGSAEEKEQRISLLVECYQIGKEADNDEELGGLLDSAGLGPLLRVA